MINSGSSFSQLLTFRIHLKLGFVKQLLPFANVVYDVLNIEGIEEEKKARLLGADPRQSDLNTRAPQPSPQGYNQNSNKSSKKE